MILACIGLRKAWETQAIACVMRPSALRLCAAACTTLTLSGRNVTFWKNMPQQVHNGGLVHLRGHLGACGPTDSLGHLANPHPHRMRPLVRVCPMWVCQPTNHPSIHPAIQPSNIPTVPVLETSCSCPKYTRNNMANFIAISPQKIGQLQAFKGPFQVYSEIKCNQGYSSVVASCDPWMISLPAGYRWKKLEVNHQFSDKSKCQ